MKKGLLLLPLLLSCAVKVEAPSWQKELATATSVEAAWEDLEGERVKKTLSGEALKKLQAHFPESGPTGATLCLFHRDASFTLPAGRRIDLCFGCGLARAPDSKEAHFDKAALKELYVSVLGEQPKQKNPFEGY